MTKPTGGSKGPALSYVAPKSPADGGLRGSPDRAQVHLNVRVPWHDDRWRGTVCRKPLENSFCVELKRIREERDDSGEAALAGKHFADLPADGLPPCRAESGAFMSERAWNRWVEHPYAAIKATQGTHGHLQKTRIEVPPYSTFAVPFLWMLRDTQDSIAEALPYNLPPDEEPPFKSSWVFSARRQEAIGNEFFGRLSPGKSLVFFYTKSAQPISENIPRLVVGVGRILEMSPILRYEAGGKPSYPLWDRLFSHSIRPQGIEGFLLPYHDYLEPTGDPAEDERRRSALAEIAVVPEVDQIAAFSYAGEHCLPDLALSVLVRSLEAVRKVREHGIASGPWDQREEWLNAQIASIWEQRGAFPGAGSALEAIDFKLGTALVFELLAGGKLDPLANPWPLLAAILEGREPPPRREYASRLSAVRATWVGLSAARRELLQLLSRFSLSPEQMKRWFDPTSRDRATSRKVMDSEILENPYLIAETDLGDWEDHPVDVGTLDRGLLPDARVEAAAPVPYPSRIDADIDARRVRAALTAVLRRRSTEGDSLLSEVEALDALKGLDLARPCLVGRDWLEGNEAALKGGIERLRLQPEGAAEPLLALQLSELRDTEARLGSILRKRAAARLDAIEQDWEAALRQAIQEGGGKVDPGQRRHREAMAEQAEALRAVTSRKLSALVGRAGTGKTTVLGALLKSKQLAGEGVLFLAPTGKARVRLAAKAGAGAEAMTVAQFLYRLKRYDGVRQRPLFEGKDKYAAHKNVVIDESSMLTVQDLFAVLQALDLAAVKRVILVGDPNQLPPIGTGRPFADLVAFLESDSTGELRGALARLTVELRTHAGEPSDALRLASLYTREPAPVDADRVLSEVELGAPFRDLTLRYWKTPNELYSLLEEQFSERLGVQGADEVTLFNRALGLTDEGFVPWADHDGAEKFQILSPTRLHAYGIQEINRWAQARFRASQLRAARESWRLSLGEEQIVWGDKVILVQNGSRKGWGQEVGEAEHYLANGEIGIAAPPPKWAAGKFLNVAFVGRPGVRFAFYPKSFGQDGAPLELAYGLTVHKAQGSEFETVFLVIPERSRLLTRELLYTALTRARGHLVLLVQGASPAALLDLSRPESSETARRNSNLFDVSIRLEQEHLPGNSRLIHRTAKGRFVRSKSELAIASYLEGEGVDFTYERLLEGEAVPGRLRPDFSFVSDAGDLVLWEHLGMLDREDYRRGWEWKREWYRKNGFREGENLFTTSEVDGLDMRAVAGVLEQVRGRIE